MYPRRTWLSGFCVFFLVLGCSPLVEEINEMEEKEALYGKAVQGLAGDNATALDKRFTLLERQIDRIKEHGQELSIAQFTRIKIELDFLAISSYNESKLASLSRKFKQAYAETERAAVEEEYQGYSLSDRYTSLQETIEQLASGETDLTVFQYLQAEQGLRRLEQDGYPVTSRIEALRSRLGAVVIAELESAILDYELPEEELVEEEPEGIILEEELPEIPPEEEISGVSEGPQTYLVEFIDGGIGAEKLTVRVNDTVLWRNAREGKIKVALVVGNNKCRDVRSRVFKTGESYNYTFTTPGTCWITDGIYTTQAMKVVVT